jgi:tRNA (guanine26-N2/guanine27-N2)-dimethyltransferase
LIQKNIEHNNVQNALASKKNLNILLSEQRFHSIDIDPFGSPVDFVDSAMRSIYHDGLLACTATDTAPLCGVYPLVCLRRYGAHPLHSPIMQEVGLRILIGFLCREAAKYDKGIEPLISYSTDYFFRVYLLVKEGKRWANQSMETLQNLPISFFSQFFNISSREGFVGPLWMGKLQKRQVLEQVRTLLFQKEMNTKHELWGLVQLLEEEADAPSFFYTMENVAARLKTLIPKRDHLFETLQQNGFLVTRTHFCPTGFKTTASLKEIEKIFKTITRL